MVQVSSISKSYKIGKGELIALKDVSLTLREKDFLVLTGRSGSGKTTLLNILGGLEKPNSGQVSFDGEKLSELSDDEISEFRRRKIGFVFQTFNLIPVMSAFENVEYPLYLLGIDRPERERRVNAILERVGLFAHAKSKPSEMSGGQRQRVAIARALVKNPALILADEPTANLDTATAQEILNLIYGLHQETKGVVVLCTHDLKQRSLGNRFIKMQDGEIDESEGQHAF